MSNIKLTIGVVLAIVIACAAYFHAPVQKALFGSTSCSDTTCLTGGLRVLTGALETNGTLNAGATGTAISRINTGQCYFAPAGTTITASSSKQIDCQATASVSTTATAALAGVTSGDNVMLTISTSTAGTPQNGLIATGCTASSTAGYISCTLFAVGGTYTWPVTGTASGTASYIVTK